MIERGYVKLQPAIAARVVCCCTAASRKLCLKTGRLRPDRPSLNFRLRSPEPQPTPLLPMTVLP
jgi:hypothetical protein